MSECTLGGERNTFDALTPGSATQNFGSTNNQGRTGASNFWGNWPRRGSAAGITARAPYDIGNPKTPNTIGGTNRHNTGLNLGPHGHGIGVVPAALGGAHNQRTGTINISDMQHGGKKISASLSLCPRCFGTWLLIGLAVVLIGMVRS